MARFKIGDYVKCHKTTGIVSAVDESTDPPTYEMRYRWLGICNISERRLKKSTSSARKPARTGKFKLGDHVSHHSCEAFISFVDDSSNPPKYSLRMKFGGKPGIKETEIEYYYTVLEEMKNKDADKCDAQILFYSSFRASRDIRYF